MWAARINVVFAARPIFFGGYKPFLSTGREVFEVCRRYEEQLGVTADLAKRLESEYRALFGRHSVKELAVTSGVTCLAAIEWARIKFVSDVRQPGSNLMRYRWQESEGRTTGYMTRALAPILSPHARFRGQAP